MVPVFLISHLHNVKRKLWKTWKMKEIQPFQNCSRKHETCLVLGPKIVLAPIEHIVEQYDCPNSIWKQMASKMATKQSSCLILCLHVYLPKYRPSNAWVMQVTQFLMIYTLITWIKLCPEKKTYICNNTRSILKCCYLPKKRSSSVCTMWVSVNFWTSSSSGSSSASFRAKMSVSVKSRILPWKRSQRDTSWLFNSHIYMYLIL